METISYTYFSNFSNYPQTQSTGIYKKHKIYLAGLACRYRGPAVESTTTITNILYIPYVNRPNTLTFGTIQFRNMLGNAILGIKYDSNIEQVVIYGTLYGYSETYPAITGSIIWFSPY